MTLGVLGGLRSGLSLPSFKLICVQGRGRSSLFFKQGEVYVFRFTRSVSGFGSFCSAGGRMAPHMKCDLKVSTYGEDRVFSEGRRRVEILEVEYYPRGLFADTKLKILIPAELATYGSKVVSSHWSGEGEDIKIESHDSYDHWLRFIVW